MSRDKEGKNLGRFDVSSRFWRIVLVLVAVLLVFAGPTYVPYVLADILKVNYFASIGLGFALLIVGLVLIWFLIRKKIIE